jgi:metallo-beta-lactamase class B
MIRTVFALLAALPSGLLAQSPDWTEPRTPVRIADQLYYVGTAGLASYLFTSDEGHILIDAPLQANVPLILENIRSLGFDPADIRIQLASHAHFDHVGGLADMREATGAELVLTEADAAFVRSGRDFGLEGVTAGYPPRDRVENP